MKIAPYINKLSDSDAFKDFQKVNKDAFMVAGFFVLDYESKNNIHQIDYYVPSKKKIAAFTLDKQVSMQMLDLMNSKVPEALDMKTNIDLDQFYGILEDEMKNRSITAEIKKIIAIIQNIDGKKIWNLSCVLSGMGILNAHVEDTSKTVLKMEKKSLLDFIQKVNPKDLKMPGQTGNEAEEGEEPKQAVNVKLNKQQISDQIKKLDQLEDAIEKQKQALSKEENKVSKNIKSKDKKKSK